MHTAPDNKMRRFFFKITESRYFESIVLITILLNTVVLALKWYEMPLWVSNLCEQLNYVFTGIYTIEAIIKILAMGYASYF